VRAQGGEITVKTRVGEGSTFTVSLPASVSSAAVIQNAGPRAPASAPPPLRGAVLIVDDEAFVGRTLRVVLEDEHDLTLATSAEEALRAIDARDADGRFDAIVCDLMMPSMSGMDLYETIAQKYPGLEQRMVFMTGGLAMRRASEFLGRVTNPTFEKPFDLDRLRATLRALVQVSQGGRH
jgi:DNA-binding NtrC family response regulator